MQPKIGLSELSLSQLSVLTGSSYRTIKKRLAHLQPISTKNKTLSYDPKRALPLIYGAELSEDDDGLGKTLDPIIQSARLSKARADKTELEIKILKGDLIKAEIIEVAWSNLVIAFRAKMLSIPMRAAQQLLAVKDFNEFKDQLTEMVHEALEELTEYEPQRFDGEGHKISSAESEASAEADD